MNRNAAPNLPLKRIYHTWWPLAASWLLMGAELPALSAIVARLADPEINLAAYGGIVFPLALIIESPVIMLLPASTALCKDWASYRKIWRFMMVTSAAMTALHVLVAFTPLYDWVVIYVIGAPAEIIQPARIGLMIMTPWTWSIAYRRFNQGVLIRFGHTQTISVGTVIRLSVDGLVLASGYLIGSIPGVVVATSAVAASVVSEAVYVGRVVRPVLKRELQPAPAVQPPLTLRAFLDFYFPLAMTSLLTLLVNPIGSAAVSRMPQALTSLAAWPVVMGLLFMLRSLGIAYNEVVVALLDEPRSSYNLRRFTGYLAAATTAALFLLTATPLSALWFERVAALSPQLASLARLALWIALPMPALSVLQSWYQGAILHDRRTRGITEAVVVFLVVSGVVLMIGIRLGTLTGLYVGMFALVFSTLIQTAWLWLRSQPARQAVVERDRNLVGAEVSAAD